MQFYFACTDKADCCAFCNIKKFQLMMPVPVDTVKIKLPDILRIICKRITFTAMLNRFPQCFICSYLKIVHNVFPCKY